MKIDIGDIIRFKDDGVEYHIESFQVKVGVTVLEKDGPLLRTSLFYDEAEDFYRDFAGGTIIKKGGA